MLCNGPLYSSVKMKESLIIIIIIVVIMSPCLMEAPTIQLLNTAGYFMHSVIVINQM